MNKFFPVAAVSVAGTTSSQATVIPTGGKMLRVSRDTSAARVFIAFGTSGVTATTSSMELVSGIVEELEIPNTTAYTYFAIITASGTCNVNLSVSPKYE